MSGRDATLDQVAAAIADHPGGVVVATHQNPDGDAIGSLLAVTRALRAAGRDVVMWHPWRPAVPEDLAFMLRDGEEVVADLPADAATRMLIALDCASEARLTGGGSASGLAGTVVNIDHHHDNGRFGELNHVDPAASSTAEILVGLADAAGWELTEPLAEALHVGIVTDTGRFSYSNVGPATFRAAARLVEAGIDLPGLARRLYENTPIERLRLLAAAVSRAQVLLDGRLVVSVLRDEDFAAAGTDDADGIAEALRGVRGAAVGVLARPTADGAHRLSMRAADDRVDVSAIAHEEGGGGHRAAAGCTTERSVDTLVTWLEDRVGTQLRSPAEG